MDEKAKISLFPPNRTEPPKSGGIEDKQHNLEDWEGGCAQSGHLNDARQYQTQSAVNALETLS
eukprot:700991-Amphidinium_carterae.1